MLLSTISQHCSQDSFFFLLLGLSEEQLKEFVESQANTIPLGRVGTPDEIAKAVVFLASDDSSFVNGIELFVDGGMAQI